MNTTKVLTIVCWIVTATVLISLTIWFLTGSAFRSFMSGRDNDGSSIFWGFNIGNIENLSGDFYERGSFNKSIDGIHSLKVDWIAGDITIEPYDGDSIKITEYAQRELNENELMSISANNGTITIKFNSQRRVRRAPPKRLEVQVPHSLINDLQELVISAASSKTTVTDTNANSIKVNSVSGSIYATGINAQTLSFNNVSGTTNISDTTVQSATLVTVAGAIHTQSLLADKISTNGVSAQVSLAGEFDDVDASMVSGSITIKSAIVPGRVKVSTVSGGIALYIPNEGEITVTHSAVSGGFSSEVPAIIQNNGAYRFSAVSGSTAIFILE
ncbi:MAG: DUF4097 domain-containing protein [Oscillospiraceae bacterium]|nr:DUF4097 domain-containing protein [Oscillospiraceae bacterium]